MFSSEKHIINFINNWLQDQHNERWKICFPFQSTSSLDFGHYTRHDAPQHFRSGWSVCWLLVGPFCHHFAYIKFASCTQLWDGSHCWWEELSFSQWWYVAESNWWKLFFQMGAGTYVAAYRLTSELMEMCGRRWGWRALIILSAGIASSRRGTSVLEHRRFFYFKALIGHGPVVGLWMRRRWQGVVFSWQWMVLTVSRLFIYRLFHSFPSIFNLRFLNR